MDREPEGRRILDFDDCKLRKIEIPEWPCDAYLGTLSGAERQRIEQMFTADPNAPLAPRFTAIVVACGLRNSKGKRLFSDADVEALDGKNGAVLVRLCKAVLDFNGMTKEGLAALEKNSSTTPGADSG